MSDSEDTISREVFERLLKRERTARKQAERLLDAKSTELYEANQALRTLAEELEQRVELRTTELEVERNLALQTAEARRLSEARYNDVANIVGEYVWELDAAFCFVSVTPQVEAVSGYCAQDLIGRSFFEAMPASDAAEVRRAMLGRIEAKTNFLNVTHRRIAKSGELQCLRSSGSPRFNAAGEWVGFLGASLDVTEQQSAKVELQKLAIALEHAGDGVAITDLRRRLTFANPAFANMFAAGDPSEVLGADWTQFVAAQDAERMLLEVSAVVTGGEIYSTEAHGRRAAEDEFPAHFSVSRLPSGDLLWICRDESERLSTLMSVQTQNSQLTALLETIRVGVIFERSAPGQLIYNPMVCEMLGLSAADFDRAHTAAAVFAQLRDASAVPALAERMDYLLSLSAEAYNIEVQFADEQFFLFDRIPVYVGQNYRGALWTVRDISEEKRRGAILEEARMQAEAGARAKSTFLANMSHEIRTPLNGICGMARLLRNEVMDETARDYVRGIQMSADSLLHVLNDILDFSKVEANQLEVEMVDFDLAHVLDSTFAILRSQAAEKPGRFDFIYPELRLPRLKGDPSRLSEILLNLLGNALKFTLDGSVHLSTRVLSVASDRVELELLIADTGIGMTPQELQRVFKPFSQADSSTSRRFGGTGLGLTICRDLAKLMGGALSVESEFGVGSTFTVQMPYTPGDRQVAPPVSALHPAARVYVCTAVETFFQSVESMLATAGIAVERLAAGPSAASQVQLGGAAEALVIVDCIDGDTSARAALDALRADGVRCLAVCRKAPAEGAAGQEYINYPFSRYKMLSTLHAQFGVELPQSIFEQRDVTQLETVDLSGLRVLLAEDNIINQKVARITIEGFGAEVDVAGNGVEALELLDRFSYDLILMDVRMPEMDGVEATRRIRAQGFNLPIYALTADAMKGDRERFLHAGMNGYLSKPLVEKELVELLSSERANFSDAPAAPEASSAAAPQASEAAPEAALPRQLLDAEVLDLASFQQLLDGDMDIVVSILNEFIDSAEQGFDEGRAAFEAGDHATARARFHKLAGSCASVYALQLRGFALHSERLLIEDVTDQATFAPLLKAMAAALPLLRAEIEAVNAQQS